MAWILGPLDWIFKDPVKEWEIPGMKLIKLLAKW